MYLNAKLLRAATLFCVDRRQLKKQFSGDILEVHLEYLRALFLEAATRPELAEQVALIVLGIVPKNKKHGLDGTYLVSKRQVEAKICTGTTPLRSGWGGITINDPSQNIIDEYDREQPEFIIAYFIDGRLAVVFSVEWQSLASIYKTELKKILESIQKGKQKRSFSLLPSRWLNNAKLKFVHPYFVKKGKACAPLPKKIRLKIDETEDHGLKRNQALLNMESVLQELKYRSFLGFFENI